MKRFFLNFLRNIAILAICLFGMYLYQPEVFGQVYKFMECIVWARSYNFDDYRNGSPPKKPRS